MCYKKLDARVGYRVPDPAALQEMCSITQKMKPGGYNITEALFAEPKIAIEGTFVKPDIVAWRKDKGFVTDPIICGDNCDPEDRYKQKVKGYNKETVKNYMREEALLVSGASMERIEVHGFAINFRGGWSTSTIKL